MAIFLPIFGYWDNLMRIKNAEVAAELLEIELERKCTNQYP